MGVCLWVKKSLVVRVWIGIRIGERGGNEAGRTRCTVRRWCTCREGATGRYIHIRMYISVTNILDPLVSFRRLNLLVRADCFQSAHEFLCVGTFLGLDT